MGAKKNRDKEILKHRKDEAKRLADVYEELGISQKKIDKIRAEETKYANWEQEVDSKPDY
jgi:DNA-directed RNA polymerase specialized sigma subunit